VSGKSSTTDNVGEERCAVGGEGGAPMLDVLGDRTGGFLAASKRRAGSSVATGARSIVRRSAGARGGVREEEEW
jgi:hypothetical protein